MKKNLLLMLVAALFAIPAFTQMDTKVTTGVVAFQQSDYKKAIKAFETALGSPDQIKSKNLPKAYYYYAQSLLRESATAAQARDEEKMLAYKDYIFMAGESYLKAKESDVDGKWGGKIDAGLMMMQNPVLVGGVQALNMAMKSDAPKVEKYELYTETVKYMDLALKIDENDYRAYDLRAQAYMNKGDSTSAHADFIKGIEKYSANPPAKPDMLTGYMFYRKALIEYYQKKDINAALATINAAKELLNSEKKRAADLGDKLTAEELGELTGKYTDATTDLSNMELDLFLRAPEKLQEALGKFKKACEDHPDDYIKHVAYASMLEQSGDTTEALKIYEKAIAIDGTKDLAMFNIGALYTNLAKSIYEKSNNTGKDYDRAEVLRKEGDSMLAKAIPYFEKALEIDPKALSVVSALKNITLNLSRMEDYEKYKAMEEALKK